MSGRAGDRKSGCQAGHQRSPELQGVSQQYPVINGRWEDGEVAVFV
jgi:hypothetical protein